MPTTFPCTLEEFKQGVAEFTKAAPECDRDSLENGMKAVGLLYLGIPTDPLTLLLAKGYLEFAQKRYMERDTILQFGHDPLARLKALVSGLPTGNHETALDGWLQRHETAGLVKGWKNPVASH